MWHHEPHRTRTGTRPAIRHVTAFGTTCSPVGVERALVNHHTIIQPPGMAPAVGYSHGVLAAPGRALYIAGQIAWDGNERIVGTTWAEQFDFALANLVSVLTAGGGQPEHITWMQIFTVDVAAYRAARADLAPIYRRHLGRHYPAMSLFGIAELVDAGALMEITALAVIPE
ncbi:MAG: hypothetical protein MNPFHGCM_01953 [Gemmatimonadaceae bacterium]|nr:hypothetical protein [Gemmatimonadaceae bacterium]